MKYHILSIGISQHLDPRANLNFASKDASEFFTLFTQNVPNLGYKKLLTDNEATLSAIRTALGTELQNLIGPEDGFVLYYSGHGTVAPTGDDTYSHYLIPFDVTEDIPNSSIPVEYIRDIFDKLNCKSKLFFVDSCFSGSINSKAYGPSYKDIKNLKTISTELSGEGSVVFTASRDDEEAIEDRKLKNSVFTSFLLKELQENRKGDRFSVIDLVTPVAEKVSAYTQKEHHFKQTPTFHGKLKELLYLPVFKKPLVLRPDLIDIPKSQDVVRDLPTNPEIDLAADKQSKQVQEIISFVLRTAKTDNPLNKLEFDRFALGIGKRALKMWEEFFKTTGRDVNEVPDAVARFEAECFQLFILTAAVGAYGNKEQSSVIAEICGDFIKTTKDRSGLIAMIHVPEVIVVYVEYLLTMTALVTSDFSKLKSFLSSKIFGMRYDTEPPLMLHMWHVHYADALTGHADKVADYIRKGLNTMEWLRQVHPRLDVINFDDLQLQSNFILVMTRMHFGGRMWADFGRFYSSRIYPVIEKIKYDAEFSKKFAEFLAIDPPTSLRQKLMDYVHELHSKGMLGGNYWWNSIDTDDLMTKKEIDQREEERRKKQA